ncbi:SPRY domain-containing protein, related [Neospora caninum Liverpool]|uniref:SPRY domain-containing protein, related n=1 Tax=Neospora caninum (strain Liverpool) TaxID=572307 RepID=F0VG72_NEOCL|nr:SPRY domain-containing protein, related [Neospora caninum Liverpool]CBZ52716.1 SPRY domain-containing protein, related [Neospora caninum Liverpool]CEL66696.1 TPA: SPRY domain-containing protein, related [Neospora caninum Liverpool]|eukprot:XP_003882748.1 SPRY domain-containing protein, related [Neospora caninum Liverpool]
MERGAKREGRGEDGADEERDGKRRRSATSSLSSRDHHAPPPSAAVHVPSKRLLLRQVQPTSRSFLQCTVAGESPETSAACVLPPFASSACVASPASASSVSSSPASSLSLAARRQHGGAGAGVPGRERRREKKRERGKGAKERLETDGDGSNLRAEARRLGLSLRNEFAEHTFDPRYSSNVRLSPDRLSATGNKNWGTSLARCCCRQGSWYFEVTIGTSPSLRVSSFSRETGSVAGAEGDEKEEEAHLSHPPGLRSKIEAFASSPAGGRDGPDDEDEQENSVPRERRKRERANGETEAPDRREAEEEEFSTQHAAKHSSRQKRKAEKDEKKAKAGGEPLAFPVAGWGPCRTLKNVREDHPESFLSDGVDSVAPCVRVGWGSRLSSFLAPIGANRFGYALSSFSPHTRPGCRDTADGAGFSPRGKSPLFVIQAGKRRALRRGFPLPASGDAHVSLLSREVKDGEGETERNAGCENEDAVARFRGGENARLPLSAERTTDGDRDTTRDRACTTACRSEGREKKRHRNASGEEEDRGNEETLEEGKATGSEEGQKKETAPSWEEVQDRLQEGDVVGCYIHLPGEEPPAILDDPRGLAQLWTFLQQGLLCDVTNDSTLPRAVPYPNSFISFSVNGLLFPRCFHDVCTAEFHPAVSLFNGASAALNLGPNFQFLSPAERRVFRPACEMGVSMYPLKVDLVKFWLLSSQSEIVVDQEYQCTYRRQRTLAEVDGDWDRARTFARMAATSGRLEFSTREERREEKTEARREEGKEEKKQTEVNGEQALATTVDVEIANDATRRHVADGLGRVTSHAETERQPREGNAGDRNASRAHADASRVSASIAPSSDDVSSPISLSFQSSNAASAPSSPSLASPPSTLSSPSGLLSS